MLRQALASSSRAISCSPSSIQIAAAKSPLRTTTTTRTQQLLLAKSLPAAALRTASYPLRTTTRWYSDEANPTDSAAGAQAAAGGTGGAAPAPAGAKEGEKTSSSATSTDPKAEIEAKAKEALEWKDRYLRSVADFRNLQDRTAREMKSARDFAIQKFAKDLVDSVDNLDRALAVVPEEKLLKASQKKQQQASSDAAGENGVVAEEPATQEDHNNPEHLKDLVNLYEGIKMTEAILLQTLQKHGLERYDPHGAPFNPNEHEATFMQPQPDKEHNTVFHTQQKGFKLHGRVLRPAKVGVVMNK